MVPTGIFLILLGIVSIVILTIFSQLFLFGIPLATCIVGIAMIAKSKSAILSARLLTKAESVICSGLKCKYCLKPLSHGALSCTLCGSKVKTIT